MAIMGKYCKAYPLTKLREFKGWSEKAEYARKEKNIVDRKEVEVNRVLTSDDFLYLQENYVVTDGIFKDENVIFDRVTPAWVEYCQQILEFKLPTREEIKPVVPLGQGAQEATKHFPA